MLSHSFSHALTHNFYKISIPKIPTQVFDLEELLNLVEDDGFALALYSAGHISHRLSEFSGFGEPTPAELESLKGQSSDKGSVL